MSRPLGSKNKNNKRISRICLICKTKFETIPALVKINKGKYCSHSCSSKGTRNKKGSHLSQEQKNKIGDFFRGKKLSDIHRQRISKGHKGEKAYQWKGDFVGYDALHSYISKLLPRSPICAKCNKFKKLSLSNISYLYKRDLSDWEWLCYSCHKKKDLKNINNRKKAKDLFNSRKKDYYIDTF